MGIIYKITHRESGKSYIGLTKQALIRRWQGHLQQSSRGSASAIHCAIRKYGADAFALEILSSHETQESLLAAEVEAIAQYGTLTPNGYNLTLGGEGGGMFGRKHSPEARAKMRDIAIAKGRRFSLEALRRAHEATRGSTWNKGRVRSEENKRKISETKRAQHVISWNKGIEMPSLRGNQHAKGYRHTEDAKKRISAAAIGNNYFPKRRSPHGYFISEAN